MDAAAPTARQWAAARPVLYRPARRRPHRQVLRSEGGARQRQGVTSPPTQAGPGAGAVAPAPPAGERARPPSTTQRKRWCPPSGSGDGRGAPAVRPRGAYPPPSRHVRSGVRHRGRVASPGGRAAASPRARRIFGWRSSASFSAPVTWRPRRRGAAARRHKSCQLLSLTQFWIKNTPLEDSVLGSHRRKQLKTDLRRR